MLQILELNCTFLLLKKKRRKKENHICLLQFSCSGLPVLLFLSLFTAYISDFDWATLAINFKVSFSLREKMRTPSNSLMKWIKHESSESPWSKRNEEEELGVVDGWDRLMENKGQTKVPLNRWIVLSLHAGFQTDIHAKAWSSTCFLLSLKILEFRSSQTLESNAATRMFHDRYTYL